MLVTTETPIKSTCSTAEVLAVRSGIPLRSALEHLEGILCNAKDITLAVVLDDNNLDKSALGGVLELLAQAIAITDAAFAAVAKS